MSDAAIPLSVKTPQIESPLDAAGRGLNLQSMAQGIQLNKARLDEERLKVQQAQEDQRDQQTIQQGYAQYPGDFKKVRELIAPKVNTRNLANFDKAVQEHASGMAKMSQDEIALRKERYGLLANHLGAVLETKPNDKSPEAVAARAAEWAKQATLVKSKGLDPEGQIPLQYPGDEALPGIDVTLRGSEAHMKTEEARRKQEDEAIKEKRAAAVEGRAAALAPSALSAAETKASLAARQAAAPVLSEAATKEEYATLYSNLDPKVAKEFPKPETFDPKTTPAKIRKLGQTSQQQATTELTQAQRDEQRERDMNLDRHQQALEAIALSRAARERGETANSQAVNKRQFQREVSKLKEEEESTAAIRAKLETAIKEGQTYVDEKGTVKTMKAASGDEGQTADALKQQMRNSYATLTNRLKRITADKNDLGQELGMGITVPTPAIHAALDADLARVSKYGQAAPAPAKPVPAGAPPVAPPPPAAPVAPPAGAPPSAPARPPQQKSGRVSVTLPDGNVYTFKDQDTLNKFAEKNGLTMAPGKQ